MAAWGWWNESNHGVNASTLTPSGNATTLVNTTSYPSDLSLGSTWNPALVYAEASQIGAEAREVSPGNTENLDFYAPTVNLSRDPRWWSWPAPTRPPARKPTTAPRWRCPAPRPR